MRSLMQMMRSHHLEFFNTNDEIFLLFMYKGHACILALVYILLHLS